MPFVKTVLPEKISAAIDIPMEIIVRMVITLVDDMVIETKDKKYGLNPLMQGATKIKINMAPSKSGQKIKITSINHMYVEGVLMKHMSNEVIAFYQITRGKRLNIFLIKYLIKLIHEDELFKSAIRGDSIVSQQDIEDMIQYDEDIENVLGDDESSLAITQDILSTIMNQIPKD